MKNKKTMLIIVAFVLLFATAYVLYNVFKGGVENKDYSNKNQDRQSQEDSDNSKILAEDFTVLDKEGKEVRLSDLKGKPIVVNFWATWCGYCEQEMPDFEEAYRELSGEVEFMMIDMVDGQRETSDKAREFVKAEGYTFPVYFDEFQEVSRKYAVTGLPTTLFIDKEGYVRANAQGPVDIGTIREGIGYIM